MKLYFMIKLLTLHYICARLPCEDINTIGTMPITQKDGVNLLTNVDGPLNFLRGYFFQKQSYMHNKRFYSIQKTFQSALKRSVRESIKEEDKYTSAYYKALICMFPSTDGFLSIDGLYSESFIGFLNKETVKEQRYNILAALLLLSEGLSVPLEWKDQNNELVLNSATEGKPFFSLTLPDKLAHNTSENSPKDVIDFFIQYKNKNSIPELINMEEFEKGDFLDSSQFLIQTYIFEFLKTVEEANQFNKAVYEILNDMVLSQKKQNPKKIEKEMSATEVFNKSFALASSKQIDYLHAMKKIDRIIHSEAFRVYAQKEIEGIDLSIKGISSKQLSALKASNNIKLNELLEDLLYLFPFLRLDLNTKMLPERKPEEPEIFYPLRDFYEQSKKRGILTVETWKEWYELFKKQKETTNSRPNTLRNIVPKRLGPQYERAAKLASDRHYMNFIDPEFEQESEVGIFDFLLIIGEVTRRYDIHTKIVQFIEELENSQIVIDDFYKRLEEYVQTTLKSFCPNNQLEIFFLNVTIEKASGKKTEVFMDLLIQWTVEDSAAKHIMPISLRKKDMTSKLVREGSTDLQSDMFKVVPNSIKQKKSFLGSLLTHYVDKTLCDLIKVVQISNLTKTIEKAFEETPISINRMSLLTIKTSRSDWTDFCIAYCISYGKEVELEFSYNSPIVHFISNVFTQIPPENNDAHQMLLRFMMYTEIDGAIAQYLQLDRKHYIEEVMQSTIAGMLVSNEIRFIAEAYCTETLIQALRTSTTLIKEREHSLLAIPLHQTEVVNAIFNCVFKNNIMDVANQILRDYEEIYGDVGVRIEHVIRIVWFLLACKRKKENLPLIQELFDSIDIKEIFTGIDCSRQDVLNLRYSYFYFYYRLLPNLTSDLNYFREHLNRKPGDPEKLSHISMGLLVLS